MLTDIVESKVSYSKSMSTTSVGLHTSKATIVVSRIA